MLRVHNHYVGERVIHLNQLERLGGLQAAGRRQRDGLCGFCTQSSTSDQSGIERADAADHRVADGCDPVLRPALTRDLSIDLLHGLARAYQIELINGEVNESLAIGAEAT
jgi:hypothetical protein